VFLFSVIVPKHSPNRVATIGFPPQGWWVGGNALLSASAFAKLPETPQLFVDFENFLTNGVGTCAPTDRSMIGIRQGTS
jgi:hypothetical protein